MMSPPHTKWIIKTVTKLKAAAGQEIRVLEFQHKNDAAVMSLWAQHFREHYCLDKVLDEAREGTGLSRKQYLERVRVRARVILRKFW
jgi:hypothetical protein